MSEERYDDPVRRMESRVAEDDGIIDLLRENEQRLSAREALARSVLDRTSVAMALVVDTRVAWINSRFSELTGYTSDELIGQSTRVIYRSDADCTATRRLAEVRFARGETCELEVEAQLKDGSGRWVELSGRQLDPSDPSKGAVWVISDRKAQREAIDALRRSEVRYRELFEASSAMTRRYRTIMQISQDGIHLLDENGTLVDANEAFLRSIGWGPEAFGALHVSQWNAAFSEAEVMRMLRELIARPRLFETKHRSFDGHVFDVEVHAGGVELEGRKYVLAASRDVTARKALEHALEVKTAQLEELNSSLENRVLQSVEELRAKDQLLITQSRHAAMGEMLGNIAHQWRQPLNALGLVLSNLRDAARFGELTKEVVEEAVADGNKLVQKMSSTINDFRDFFRPEKEKHAFSAIAQIHETVGLVDASFRHAGIRITIESASDVVLFGYANELSQVILNLLANARHAILGSKREIGRVKIRLGAEGDFGSVVVTDNGGGIPDKIMGKIFEPYFSTKDSGSGIGLYMSRQIVERSLGGRIWARNVDDGAELTVLVPAATGRTESDPRGRSSAPERSP